MPTKNTIRRHYLIIRRILRNDYPSKHILLEYMKQYDVEVGERTFQRDLAEIRSNFDIEIIYDEKKNGYFAQTDSTLELDKLLYFIGLAESSDIALSTMRDKNRLLDSSSNAADSIQIPPLLPAYALRGSPYACRSARSGVQYIAE